ncbi:MAG: transcriptional regulator [Myxococcales bacterium]|nr:transcriptional regulator [Myxococcales bacterium]
MSEERVIKRYANRKLYDTQHSRYVTLDQISEMIREGDDVKIIDNKSKEDLTSVTLAQIIFEEEKKQKSFLPLQAMRNIIQTGGESINQLVSQAQHKIGEAQRKVTDILPNSSESEAASESGEVGTEYTDLAQSKSGPLAIREFREFLVTSQRTIDDWQRRMDDRIRGVVEGISPFRGIHSDVQGLSERIAELEAKLGAMVEEEEQGTGAEQSTNAE